VSFDFLSDLVRCCRVGLSSKKFDLGISTLNVNVNMKKKLTVKIKRLIYFGFIMFISPQFLAVELNSKSAKIKPYKAEAEFTGKNELAIKLNTNKGSRVALSPVKGVGWDLYPYHGLKVTLTNTGKDRIIPEVKLKSPELNKWQLLTHSLYLEPEETKTLLAYFYITEKDFQQRYPKLKKMRGGPGAQQSKWTGINLETISEISFSSLNIKDYISGKGSYVVKEISPFTYDQLFDYPKDVEFPFIDEYGQYMQGKYPGKLSSASEWAEREQQELDDLKAHPGPEERSKWGGWLEGPKQEATGNFYVKQVAGKWWFVDPDGYLFWSHGVTGVGLKGANTLIRGRREYFSGLSGRTSHFDYTQSNLHKKYGGDWEDIAIERNHQRIKSWGMNTFANWSKASTYRLDKTPFTVAVNYKARMLEAKFPDPWDNQFANNIKQLLLEKKHNEHADSAWNLGFFIDNELHWFNAAVYARIITSAPAEQPAKIHFVNTLKSKYKTIRQLNHFWQTTFTSFDAILSNRKKIKFNKIQEDAKLFYQQMAEQYYKICRDALKSVFPNHLYLGSRLHGDMNTTVLRAAEKYADVISYNLYRRNLRDFTTRASGLTKPLMATEFHFGAMDRGMFSTGLQGVSSQKERAQHYYEYVLGALKNPLFVGTHWFQYRSQAFTGRGDGENYQIGLVDITDTPYPETIEAVRKIGYKLYETRWQ